MISPCVRGCLVRERGKENSEDEQRHVGRSSDKAIWGQYVALRVPWSEGKKRGCGIEKGCKSSWNSFLTEDGMHKGSRWTSHGKYSTGYIAEEECTTKGYKKVPE